MTAALAALGLLLANAEPPAVWVEGYASAYAPTVFEDVVEHRFANDWWRNPPPPDWYTVAGYAAVTDCGRVGEVVELRPVGAQTWQRVLIADCVGDMASLEWMLSNKIVAELDARLFARWVGEWGAPLALEMRP